MPLAQAPVCLVGEFAGSDLRSISGDIFESNVRREEFRLVDRYSVILLWLKPWLCKKYNFFHACEQTQPNAPFDAPAPEFILANWIELV